MDPKLDAWLCLLLDAAAAEFDIGMDVVLCGSARSATHQDLDLASYVFDYVGIPQDTSAGHSQAELKAGHCDHGVDYYCRDWLWAWVAGEEDARKEHPTSADFLRSLQVHAACWHDHQFTCPRCAAGEITPSRQAEIDEMLASAAKLT